MNWRKIDSPLDLELVRYEKSTKWNNKFIKYELKIYVIEKRKSFSTTREITIFNRNVTA